MTGIDLRPFIAGQRREAAGASLDRLNPADGQPGMALPQCSGEQVDEAVAAARQAWADGWRWLAPGERQTRMLELARLVSEHADELGRLDSIEMGKPLGDAVMDAHVAAGFISYAAQAIDKRYGATTPLHAGRLETQQRVPHGVVGAIVPWNFPIINVALKAGPALATGNTIVIKPSELASGSALLFAELAREAGLANGVVNVVTGDATVGDRLVRHPGIDLVTFTGSTATGRRVMAAAAAVALKPVLLECGGKSAQLVFADIAGTVPMDSLVQACSGAALWNQGQVCVSRSRFYVERPIVDAFTEALVAHLGEIEPAAPDRARCSFGPLASRAQYDKVSAAIAAGEAAGARLVIDGRKGRSAENGFYLGPTLFTDVAPDNPLMREEIFGPVIALAAFDSEAEAVALANDSEYGLAATAWTGDFTRAHRLGEALEAGTVAINGVVPQGPGCWQAHAAEPFKQSGFGAEGGMAGFDAYTRLKSVQFAYG